MKGLHYKNFKRVSSDEDSTTLRHPLGHELKIAHGPLSKEMKSALLALPMTEGGEAKKPAPKPQPKPQGPNLDPQKTKQFIKATGFAEGGAAESAGEFIGKRLVAPVVQGAKDTYETYKNLGQGALEGAGNLASGVAKGAGYAPEKPVGIGLPGEAPVPAPSSASDSLLDNVRIQSHMQDAGTPLETQLRPKESILEGTGEGTPASTPEIPATQAADTELSKPVQEAEQVKEISAPTPEDRKVDTLQDLHQEHQAFTQDLWNGHIQPKTYQDLFHEKSTLGKVGTLFGLLLSGVGSGLAHQPNAVLAMMEKEIDRDVSAQEKNEDNRMSIYKINQQNLMNQAQIQHLQQQGKLTEQQAKALTQDTQIKAKAQTKAQAMEVAFHKLVDVANKLPDSDPRKAQANQTLAAIYPEIKANISNLFDMAAGANAVHRYGNAVTPAQKEVDQQYAKDYVEWAGKGKAAAEKGLTELEEAKTELEKHPSLAGRRIRGLLPDALTSSAVLAQRQRILRAALPTLKATFGAQLSDKEREAALQSYYNEKADAATNVKGLERLIQDVRTDMAKKNELATEYQKRGTLSKYKPELKTPEATPETIERLDPKSGRTVVYDAKTKKPLRWK